MAQALMRALLVAFAVVITGALCEVILRLFEYPHIPESGWRTERPRPLVNQLGFRGRPIEYGPDDFVVVLVGDSHVECDACGADDLPEIILERALRRYRPHVRVFSIGASGYGQDQQLLGLREYFRAHRADWVLVWQTIDNDVWNNLFPTHWPGRSDGWPKPTFWLRNGELRGPTQLVGEPVFRSRVWALIVMNLLGGVDRWWERSLPPAYSPVAGSSSLSDAPVIPPPHALESLRTEKSHVAIHLTPPSARMEYALDLTGALLTEMAALASVHGAELFVFSFDERTAVARAYPMLYRLPTEAFFFEEGGRLYAADGAQAERNRSRLNRGLRHVSIPIREPAYRVGRRDPHLSAEGNRQVLGDLAEALHRDIDERVASRPRAAPDDLPVGFAPAHAPYAPGDVIDFGSAEAERFFGPGWSHLEPEGTWTVGHEAALSFTLSGPSAGSLTLEMGVHPVAASRARPFAFDVVANGVTAKDFRLVAEGWQRLTVPIPEDTVGVDRRLEVVLRVPEPRTPTELGLSPDSRALGLRVRRMRIVSRTQASSR